MPPCKSRYCCHTEGTVTSIRLAVEVHDADAPFDEQEQLVADIAFIGIDLAWSPRNLTGAAVSPSQAETCPDSSVRSVTADCA